MTIEEKNTGYAKTIAILSASGGCGSTKIAVTAAEIFSANHNRVTLIDADFFPGRLTYFLNSSNLRYDHVGLSNVQYSSSRAEATEILGARKWIQRIDGDHPYQFVGAGDFRRQFKMHRELDTTELLRCIFGEVRDTSDVIIVDCRGGIDEHSLAICRAVDDIIFVLETGLAPFRITENLISVLHEHSLANKSRGFVIHDVVEDPSEIAESGVGSFGIPCLGALPFDLTVAKMFGEGYPPTIHGEFSTQLWAALKIVYDERISNPPGQVSQFKEFREIELTDKNSIRGAVIILVGMMAILTAALVIGSASLEIPPIGWGVMVLSAIFLFVLSRSNSAKSIIGRRFDAVRSKDEKFNN